MRAWCLLGLSLVWWVAPALAAMPPLLDAAIRKLQADEDHWAFTQTVQEFDGEGQPTGGPTVERYDPSRPDARQWQLLQWRGHAPSEHERRVWRRRKEKEMRRREDKKLGEVMDFDGARAVRDTPDEVVFEVPLRRGESGRLPADKFVVQMLVNRQRETLQSFKLTNRERFRALGIARIDDVEIVAQFGTIDERYAPQPYFIRARGAGRLLFFKVGGGAEVHWSDFRRVKPYKDRFEVKIGELKAFGF